MTGHSERVITATRQVLLEVGTMDPEYRAFLQQDAFQRVQALLKSLECEVD